jgi:hypothetical protein
MMADKGPEEVGREEHDSRVALDSCQPEKDFANNVASMMEMGVRQLQEKHCPKTVL